MKIILIQTNPAIYQKFICTNVIISTGKIDGSPALFFICIQFKFILNKEPRISKRLSTGWLAACKENILAITLLYTQVGPIVDQKLDSSRPPS